MPQRKAKFRLGQPVAGSNHLPENLVLVAVMRRQRQQRGWSQNKFAQRAGFTRQFINQLESGKYLPGLDVVGFVARKLGVRPSKLMAQAEDWVAGCPECCDACKYACMARGELPCLNARYECDRGKA